MKQDNRTKTVLITGASCGIGLELSRLFAKDHYNMVIVARNHEHLEQVATEFRHLGAASVLCIPADLSVSGNALAVYNETRTRGIHVDILVNDAGAGEHGLFAETDLQRELGIIQLNIASLVVLTKLYLRDMLTRNEGKILNLASIASYQPTPRLAVYAATKAFVLSFSDALSYELENTGVTITALIPPPTDTAFFESAGAEHTRAATENPEDPAVVADVGYEALMAGRYHATPPGIRRQIFMSSIMSNHAVATKAAKQMEPAEPFKDGENTRNIPVQKP